MEEVKESCSDSNVDVPNSSGSKDLGKTLPEEAFNNFLQGKRHMLVQDYSFAVSSLATACELYVEHFGELAYECAEVYFLYGKALFRLSQQQAGILGGALNEGSNEENSTESENENEKENESEKNSEGEEEGEENEAEDEKEEKEPSESTDSPPTVVDEGSSDVKTNDSSSDVKAKGDTLEPAEDSSFAQKEQSSESNATCDQTAESSENKNDETQEVEEDDLELAWNTLETAKSIFKRRDTVEAQLKVAEILLLLAEISMESDNNTAAINDIKECLEIQTKHLQPDNRILAETYYQMGLALMLDKKYPEALENFETTKHILELRIKNLKNTPVDKVDDTFACADIEAEISDLESILVDIKEKIDDTEELICNKKKELEESSIDQPGSSSISKEKDEKNVRKPVSNITHLLKRKKPDEGVTDDNAKRIKTSGVLNGDSKVAAPET